MSKERELLEELSTKDMVSYYHPDLINRIKDLLAQPEQEPVAWCQMVKGEVQDLLTSFEMKDWIKDDSWTLLYTSPQKQEPLDLDQVDRYLEINDYSDEYRHAYCEGIIFAEKEHRIGGGECLKKESY